MGTLNLLVIWHMTGPSNRLMFKKVLLGMQTLPMPARWGVGNSSPSAGCRRDLTPEPRSLLAGFAVSYGSRGHGELEVRAISPLGRQAAADLVRRGARRDSSPAIWEDWEPSATAAQRSGKTWEPDS